MNYPVSATRILALMLSLTGVAVAQDTPERPVQGIMDNSFLVEEAYNQEPGVIQHIFSAAYSLDTVHSSDGQSWNMTFTQEWPLFGQTNQLSYTVPVNFAENDGHWSDGLGEVLLNYRWQAYLDDKALTGFSPRFSLVLPTGDADYGFGNHRLGYQGNLPFSTTIGDRWFVHANAGLTYLPDLSDHGVVDYNLGASAIYCISNRFNLMLEWIGNWNESRADDGGIEHEFSSVVSPGIRYAFNFENGSQLVPGLGVPIGVTHAAPDIGAFLYLSFEHDLFFNKRK